MLDRFPVELLSHVLRLAAPLEYTPDKYRERRELLRRLCLVCKRVRDVAQPMLSEVFAVKEGEERADGGRLSRSSEVKILVISGRNSEVEAFVASCGNLSELRLLYCGTFSLNALSHVPGLRRLVVCGSTLTASASCTLPTLVELSLLLVEYIAMQPSAVLTSAFLPSLRTLSITIALDSWCWRDRHLPFLPTIFLHQLEALGVNVGDIPMHDLFSLSPAPVLVDTQNDSLPFFDHTSPIPPALRLLISHDLTFPSTSSEAELQSLTEELTPLAGEISRFASNLSHRTPGFTSLHLLILPDKMKSSYPRVSVVEEARSALLEACDYCQIEVLYDEPLSWPDESLVSPVFWDWARRKMREKAEKGRIVEQGV